MPPVVYVIAVTDSATEHVIGTVCGLTNKDVEVATGELRKVIEIADASNAISGEIIPHSR